MTGEEFKTWRKANALNQTAAGEIVGYSRITVIRWEKGEAAIPEVVVAKTKVPMTPTSEPQAASAPSLNQIMYDQALADIADLKGERTELRKRIAELEVEVQALKAKLADGSKGRLSVVRHLPSGTTGFDPISGERIHMAFAPRPKGGKPK